MLQQLSWGGISCDFRCSCCRATYPFQILVADIKQEREEKTSIGRNTGTSGRLGISEQADPVAVSRKTRVLGVRSQECGPENAASDAAALYYCLDQLIRKHGSRITHKPTSYYTSMKPTASMPSTPHSILPRKFNQQIKAKGTIFVNSGDFPQLGSLPDLQLYES
ncbi:hypothetical protein NQZ68_003956 [Dissostichus eleginoides]|nr:hypothetical protein NQZ68_003956 [Dissostichus eleginoides]